MPVPSVPSQPARSRSRPAVLYYRMLGTTARIEADEPVAVLIDRLCSQFALAPRPPDVVIDVREEADGCWSILWDGERIATRTTAAGAARHVEWRLVGFAARTERQLVHLHAAGVAHGDEALLIAGASRTGKSSLALALSVRGLEVLGEDIVFVDPASGALHPFPRSPHVREDVLPLLEAAGLPARATVSVPGFLDPGAVPRWRTTAAARLAAVILLEPPGGRRPTLAPMTQAEAAVDLVLHSHHLPTRRDAWQILQRTLAPARCYRLRLAADLGEAAALVRPMLREP